MVCSPGQDGILVQGNSLSNWYSLATELAGCNVKLNPLLRVPRGNRTPELAAKVRPFEHFVYVLYAKRLMINE